MQINRYIVSDNFLKLQGCTEWVLRRFPQMLMKEKMIECVEKRAIPLLAAFEKDSLRIRLKALEKIRYIKGFISFKNYQKIQNMASQSLELLNLKRPCKNPWNRFIDISHPPQSFLELKKFLDKAVTAIREVGNCHLRKLPYELNFSIEKIQKGLMNYNQKTKLIFDPFKQTLETIYGVCNELTQLSMEKFEKGIPTTQRPFFYLPFINDTPTTTAPTSRRRTIWPLQALPPPDRVEPAISNPETVGMGVTILTGVVVGSWMASKFLKRLGEYMQPNRRPTEVQLMRAI